MTVIIFFILGLIVGSFLNVVVYRLDLAESIFWGRSHCPECKKNINWYDNVPLLSFIVLKAKCRDCQKKISWQYPVMELVTGIVFALVGSVFFLGGDNGSWTETGFYLTVFSLLLVILVYDLKFMEIPMEVLWLAVFSVALYYLYFDAANFKIGMDVADSRVYSGALGGLVAFLFFFSLSFFSKEKWMGMGDAYLALLAGFLLGWPLIIVATMLSFFIGAVTGVTLMLLGKKTMQSRIPFAPFLVTGIFISLFIAQLYPQLKFYLFLPLI